MLPKIDLHPSLEPSADNTAETLLAGLLWQLYALGIFPDSGFDVLSDQSLSILAGEETIATDFDTGEKFLFRELRIRLREPYEVPGFSAGNY